jgi:uncharacterized protein YkwD
MRVAILLLVASTAHAAASRYNEPVADTGRSALVARLLGSVAEVARAQRREVPRPDIRLDRACEDVARHSPPDGRPSNELVQAAMWHNGLVEPPPHLIVATAAPSGDDDQVIEELRNQLPKALSEGQYRRAGAAVVPFAGGRVMIVALQESALTLEPVPRALPFGGPAPLHGKLEQGFQRPEVLVTAPDGKVTRLESGADPHGFAATFRCGAQKGRYQVEIAADDRFGSTVVANFPIYCGQAAPSALPTGPGPRDTVVSDAAGAEAVIARLVNQDRARAGLPPLETDARLAEVARAHSLDMHQHDFVGHVSPSTGAPSDRVKRAKIDAVVVAENVARAYSPEEAERGLMESPGHRANILGRDVTRLGVGVVMTPGLGGVKELLVTQLFIKPPERVVASSHEELRKRINELRRGVHVAPLEPDKTLDELAQQTAEQLAKGELRPEHAGEPTERALGHLSRSYSEMRTVVASGSGLPQLVQGVAKSVLDGSENAVGVGLATGHRPDGSAAVFAVVVLGARR